MNRLKKMLCSMKTFRIFTIGLFSFFIVITAVPAEEKIYYDVVRKIIEFESENSDVMENAIWLCDVFGSRSLKSPSYREAAEWCVERLKEYGLNNAHLFTSGAYHDRCPPPETMDPAGSALLPSQ